MTNPQKPMPYDEDTLWDLLEKQDLSDLDVVSDPDALMSLAADIDAFGSTAFPADNPIEATHPRDQIAIAAADIMASRQQLMDDQDPTLVALKNRAAALVRDRQASARMGLRSWLGTCVTALSLGIAGFSTVYALAPFALDTGTSTVAGQQAITYQLSESSLYGTQSVWNFDSIE